MTYLIVGGGSLATHLRHYFDLAKLHCIQWQRRQDSIEDLQSKIKNSDLILLCISDSSIKNFYDEHCAASGKICVHFSGSLSIAGLYSAHPLMSFGPSLYTLPEYERMPFITEKDMPKFNEVFPELKNPHQSIESSAKPLYHALCAMMVNIPQILWSESAEVLEKNTGIQKSMFLPILKKALENFVIHGNNSITGAIARKDEALMKSHILQLEKQKLADIYKDTANLYLKKYGDAGDDRTLS